MGLFNLAVETTERYIQHPRVKREDAEKQIAALRAVAQTLEQKDQIRVLEQILAQREKK